MKKYLLLFSVLIISLSACNKTDATTQATVDDAKIQAYIKANNIKVTKDPSGIYYEVITPGTGANPTATATVKVAYTGRYLNGQQFQPEGTSSTLLSTFISGFQTGVEHINAGGRILIIVPSGLGYGPNGDGTGAIAANAVLVFTVDLVSFYQP